MSTEDPHGQKTFASPHCSSPSTLGRVGATSDGGEEALISLAKYLAGAGHVTEPNLAIVAPDLRADDLVERKLLRRVLGPGRFDDDWLVPMGRLLALTHSFRTPAYNAWGNRNERN